MYETGPYSSGSDLLNKLHTFAVANGWANDANAVEGSGRRAHFSKSGFRANFRAYENEARYSTSTATNKNAPPGAGGLYTDYMLCMNISNGAYQSGDSWDKQGGSGAVATPTVSGGALTVLAVGASGGTGYLRAPQVVFSGTWTTQPVATAVLTADVVTSFTIVQAGSGITGTLFVHIISKDHPGTIDSASVNPSKPLTAEMRGITAAPAGTYHFFQHASPDTIWVALEIGAGVMRHFGFGQLDKDGAGTYTGGEWFCGPQQSKSAITTNPLTPFESRAAEAGVSCFAHVEDVDGFTGWLGHIADSFSRGAACTGKGLGHGLVEVNTFGQAYAKLPMIGGYAGDPTTGRYGMKFLSRNVLNTEPMTLPFYMWVERTKGANYSPLGVVGHVRFINMQDKQLGELLDIGGEDYRVFPFNVRTDTAAGAYFDGVAIKV